MISIRKQEFLEFFLQGVCFIVTGALGYVTDSPIVDIAAMLLAVIYAITCIIAKVKKRESDDELSSKNKHRAAYVTFLIMIMVMISVIGIMLVMKRSMSAPIVIDLRLLCFFLGLPMIIYYLFFIHYEKAGEEG